MGLGVISIRPLTESDVAAAAALEAAHQPAPWSENVFRDELVAPSRIYLAADAGELVGFAGVLLVADEAHVTNLLVSPDHRRRGVARRLLVALIEAAVDQGARHLTLEVRTANAAARSLYSSLGMAPVGIRPQYYGDDDALIMWAHDIDSAGYQEWLRSVPRSEARGEGTAGRREEAGGRGAGTQHERLTREAQP